MKKWQVPQCRILCYNVALLIALELLPLVSVYGDQLFSVISWSLKTSWNQLKSVDLWWSVDQLIKLASSMTLIMYRFIINKRLRKFKRSSNLLVKSSRNASKWVTSSWSISGNFDKCWNSEHPFLLEFCL